MDTGTIINIVLIAILIAVILYASREISRAKKPGEDNTALGLIKQDLGEIRNEIRETSKSNLDNMRSQLGESGKLIKDVTTQLEKIHGDHEHVKDLKGELGKLADVLSNPKQRGILGEYLLETVLKNILPPTNYQLQYRLGKDEQGNELVPDAVIFVKEKIIPVDAKFSLDNYNRIVNAQDKNEREKLEKIFKNDLKNRIDETSKYIKPDLDTMDFAFMFIPAEAIYYDLLVNKVGAVKVNTRDLIEYAFREKHVIIVSPTSFHAYLQTVLQGLRALQIEESAKEIRKRVGELQKHLANYDVFMQKLGGNLSTTVNAYNRAHKELGKVDKDIVKIAEGERKIEPMEVDKPALD